MHAADDVELCAHMYHTRRAAAHEQIKLLRFRLLDGVFGGVGVRMSVAARLCVTYRFPCAKCTATCNRVCVCVFCMRVQFHVAGKSAQTRSFPQTLICCGLP